MSRKLTSLCVTFSIAVFAAACGSDETPDVAANDVREETREAADAAEKFLETQRRQLVEQAEASADGLGKEIDQARAELAEVPGETNAKLQAAIRKAEEVRSDLEIEIARLQNASAERWDQARQRLSGVMAEVSEARREVAAALAGDEAESSS